MKNLQKLFVVVVMGSALVGSCGAMERNWRDPNEIVDKVQNIAQEYSKICEDYEKLNLILENTKLKLEKLCSEKTIQEEEFGKTKVELDDKLEEEVKKYKNVQKQLNNSDKQLKDIKTCITSVLYSDEKQDETEKTVGQLLDELINNNKSLDEKNKDLSEEIKKIKGLHFLLQSDYKKVVDKILSLDLKKI